MVNGEGRFAPLMIIIKHSVSSKARPDQTGMRVIPNLHKQPGFGVADGWQLHTWSADLNLSETKSGPPVNRTHRVHYLINTLTGHVITSQHNDQVRMRMWLELVVVPLLRRDGKLLLWMDNCSLHKTDSIHNFV